MRGITFLSGGLLPRLTEEWGTGLLHFLSCCSDIELVLFLQPHWGTQSPFILLLLNTVKKVQETCEHLALPDFMTSLDVKSHGVWCSFWLSSEHVESRFKKNTATEEKTGICRNTFLHNFSCWGKGSAIYNTARSMHFKSEDWVLFLQHQNLDLAWLKYLCITLPKGVV